MTLRENSTFESWENRKLHDLQEKNEIQAMGNPERPWPTGEKWNLGHGKPGKAMTYKRKMKSRPWETRKGHDLQEKNEIQVMVELERPWPTREKWNPGHGGTGKAMIYKRKMKSRPWEIRKGYDLQEKNEIQIIKEMETAWSGDSACSEWICIK